MGRLRSREEGGRASPTAPFFQEEEWSSERRRRKRRTSPQFVGCRIASLRRNLCGPEWRFRKDRRRLLRVPCRRKNPEAGGRTRRAAAPEGRWLRSRA